MEGMRLKGAGLSRERMAGHCRVKRRERKAALRKASRENGYPECTRPANWRAL